MKTTSLMLSSLLIGFSLFQGDWHTSKVTVPDDLVDQGLGRARDALEKGNLDLALKIYQTTLDGRSKKVVFSHRMRRRGDEAETVLGGDRFTGVRDYVLDQLRTLPDQGLTRYRELMEPVAKRLYDTAWSHRDEHALVELSTRFFLTPSGLGGAFLHVDWLLEEGRFSEAFIHARRLRGDLERHQGTPEQIAQSLAREALSLRGSGRFEELRQVARLTEGEAGKHPLKIAGESVGVGTFVADLLEADAKKPASSPSAFKLSVMGSRTWYHQIATNRSTQGEQYLFSQRVAAIRLDYNPVVPTVADGVVYSSDGRQITGRNLFTGEYVWPPVVSDNREFVGRLNRLLLYHTVVDRGLVFGYLEGTPYSRSARNYPGFQPVESVPTRKLVAVDATTGDIRWSHLVFSTENSEERDFIDQITVNGPPLIRGDTLYVPCTYYYGVFRHWLCAFDRNTGHLKWKTYVAGGQMELNMFGNPVKEAIPGFIAEHEGVLYYSTNIGVIAAVNAANGSIVWISAYEQEGIPSNASPVTRERYPGWIPSSPAFFKDKMFVAPSDSFHVYAVDLKTGLLDEVRAARRTMASRNHYFLGIHQGVLLVGGKKITAINPESYGLVWETMNPQGRFADVPIKGIPAVHGDSLYFMTASQDQSTVVHRVGLETGRLDDSFVLRYSRRAGNLVIAPDAVLVGSEDAVHCYFDLKEVESRLARDARDNSGDPRILMRLGDVKLKQGNFGSALETFARARAKGIEQGPAGAPIVRRASQALYNGWLELARNAELRIPQGPNTPDERFFKALTFADSDNQRVRVLKECLGGCLEETPGATFQRTASLLVETYAEVEVVLDGKFSELLADLPTALRLPAGLLASLTSAVRLEEVGKHRDAVAWYQRVLLRYPNVILGQQSAWTYAGQRIQALIKQHGDGVYRIQEAEARRLFTEAKERGDTQALRGLLGQYPQSTVVEEAYLELSRKLLDAGSHREALGEMQRYLSRFGRASAPVMFEYTRCLDRLEAYDSALQLLSVLESRFGTKLVTVDGASQQVSAWVLQKRAEPPYAQRLLDRPLPVLEAGLSPAWSFGRSDAGEDARLVRARGFADAKTASLVIGHVNKELVALDARSGNATWRKACVRFPEFSWWHDGSFVTSLDGDVVSLDALTGRENWRVRIRQSQLKDLACGHGKVYLLRRPVLGPELLILEGLDITTGESVQETVISRYKDGTLSVSPAYVMIRTDPESHGYTCDGMTGQLVGNPLRFTREAESFLAHNNLAIVTTGSQRSTRTPVKISGLDPATGADAWSYDLGPGEVRHVWQDGHDLLIALRSPPDRRGILSKVVLIDLDRGRTRFSSSLDYGEFVTHGERRGDYLFVTLMATTQDRRDIARLVRAYDIPKGHRLWHTPNFPGASTTLLPYPTRDFLLVRKALNSGTPSRDSQGELFFIRMDQSGRTEDLVTLGDTSYAAYDDPGIEVAAGTLVIAVGPEIRGLRK